MAFFTPVVVPYPLKPEVRNVLMAVVDTIIDRNLDGTSQTQTKLGTFMEYGHAAKKLCRACPDVPFRTAFALVRSEMAHAIA